MCGHEFIFSIPFDLLRKLFLVLSQTICCLLLSHLVCVKRFLQSRYVFVFSSNVSSFDRTLSFLSLYSLLYHLLSFPSSSLSTSAEISGLHTYPIRLFSGNSITNVITICSSTLSNYKHLRRNTSASTIKQFLLSLTVRKGTTKRERWQHWSSSWGFAA